MKNKEKFGDIVENHDLVKTTLMAAAFPALITSEEKDGQTSYKGFLPGFEFANVEDIETEDELVETLQDMLDDEVEELVVFGKSLPNVEDDDKLLKKNPGYRIVYLDINVYASKEEMEYYDACTHDCHTCSGHCHDEDCDCEDEEDYCDDENCGCHHDFDGNDEDCHCGEDD